MDQHLKRVRFLQTTLLVDCDRGEEISVDVTRDGTFYIEGPLGITKTDKVLNFLGTIRGVKLYHHDLDIEEEL